MVPRARRRPSRAGGIRSGRGRELSARGIACHRAAVQIRLLLGDQVKREAISVLVTGVGGGGHGHEVAKALKLADRYRIVGLDMSPTSFGLFDLDAAFVVPPASDPS